MLNRLNGQFFENTKKVELMELIENHSQINMLYQGPFGSIWLRGKICFLLKQILKRSIRPSILIFFAN